MIRQELWRDGNMDYNTSFFFFFLCQHYMPHPYQSEDNGTHSCIQHVKPRNLQQQPDVTTGRKNTRTWEKKNSRISLALTHIFKGQHDDCDDARHEHDHPQDAEKSLTLGEVHLFFLKKTNDRHVNKEHKQKVYTTALNFNFTQILGFNNSGCTNISV